MASNGYFDFENQTWVHDGEDAPQRAAPVGGPATTNGSSGAALFLLIAGIAATALGAILVFIAWQIASDGDLVGASRLSAVGSWLIGIGALLLLILVSINAFIDVWQRRMREPE